MRPARERKEDGKSIKRAKIVLSALSLMLHPLDCPDTSVPCSCSYARQLDGAAGRQALCHGSLRAPSGFRFASPADHGGTRTHSAQRGRRKAIKEVRSIGLRDSRSCPLFQLEAIILAYNREQPKPASALFPALLEAAEHQSAVISRLAAAVLLDLCPGDRLSLAMSRCWPILHDSC